MMYSNRELFGAGQMWRSRRRVGFRVRGEEMLRESNLSKTKQLHVGVS